MTLAGVYPPVGGGEDKLLTPVKRYNLNLSADRLYLSTPCYDNYTGTLLLYNNLLCQKLILSV